MYLVVRKYRQFQGDKREIADSIKNGFLPLISKIDGFVDYYCIFPKDGSLLSVSVFRDEAGADASVRAAASWANENIAKHFPDKPEIIAGEVFAHRS